MKKLKYLVLIIGMAGTAAAQDTSVGFLLGANGSIFQSKFLEEKPLAGLNAGVFINHSKKEHAGIKAELLYSQMGSAFENTDSQVKLHYVQIPIYGVYYFNDRGDDFRPKIMIGPYVGFLAKTDGATVGEYSFGDGNFNKVDFGAKGAIGFNYLLNDRLWLNTELTYGQSLANINTLETSKILNGSGGLNVGISFPLK